MKGDFRLEEGSECLNFIQKTTDKEKSLSFL